MCGVAGFLFAGFLFSASTGSTAGLMSYDISNKIDVVDLGMSFRSSGHQQIELHALELNVCLIFIILEHISGHIKKVHSVRTDSMVCKIHVV